MDDVRIGSMCRAVRIRRRLTQAAVARSAGVHQWDVSRLEGGRLDPLRMVTFRRILAALDMRLDLRPQYRGPELERLMNAAHVALHGAVLRLFLGLPGWEAVPEASYSIYGERGAIDILAWHRATRTVLIVELKTVLVDVEAVVRKVDERRRLATEIARQRGWHPLVVATWVILTDTRTNRRHVSAQHEILAPVRGVDGRRMRAWLRSPYGPVAALSFWDEPSAVNMRRIGVPRRARVPARPGEG
jgi:transcriptional regulator with XRE-family HTH domain